jgi:hypothetical protein
MLVMSEWLRNNGFTDSCFIVWTAPHPPEKATKMSSELSRDVFSPYTCVHFAQRVRNPVNVRRYAVINQLPCSWFISSSVMVTRDVLIIVISAVDKKMFSPILKPIKEIRYHEPDPQYLVFTYPIATSQRRPPAKCGVWECWLSVSPDEASGSVFIIPLYLGQRAE